MSISRALLCIFLPPVAVLHRGGGPTVLVFILTLLGWIPGCIAALIFSGQQRLDDTANAYSLPRLPQSKWDALLRQLPPAGPFEPAATEMQLDHLWRMGCVETSKIKEIRKLQASWLIDAGMRQSAKRGLWVGVVVLFMLLVFGGAGAAVWYFEAWKLPIFQAAPKPAPTPVPTAPAYSSARGEAFGQAPAPTPTPAPVFVPEPEPEPEGQAEGDGTAEEGTSLPPPPSPTPTPVSYAPLEIGQEVVLLKEIELRGSAGVVNLHANSTVKVLEIKDEWIIVGDDKLRGIIRREDVKE